ncbi:MAG: DUF2188 domain-containing protein [Bdellovibrionales bacterium]|nr:DUF2188 domain-containing protein [Bdellovibrionales bacterium]
MSEKNFHVVRLGKGWSVKSNGRVLSSHNTQQNAAKSAVVRAKRIKSEVVIHGRDGRIRSKDSYGNDPFPPRDKEY